MHDDARTTADAAAEPGGGNRRSRLLRRLALIGPAFVVGAWQFGPGNLTSAVQAGGLFGYRLIWVIVVSTALMIMFTDMSVRIALSSGESMVETVKRVLGKVTGVLAGIGVFGISLMFSVGNAVGSGLGLSLVFGGSPVIWTLVCTVVVAVVVLARDFYTVVERLLLAIVALMAVGFIASAVLTRPDWGDVAAGFIPNLPPGVGLLLIALVGTNFSINAAFYTGYATRERGLTRSQYRDVTISDTIPGIVAPGIMTILVIVAGAAALGGSSGGTLQQLAEVLEPVAGPAGRIIFALGFFGAAFSSMVANATAGGTLLSDGLGWGNRLSSRRVRAMILVVLAFGALVAVLAQGSPVELIILAQALTVLVAPFLGVLLFLLANTRRLMGDLRNRWWQNIVATIGLLSIAATCLRLITTFS
ncbi:Nramp family divalent metal transporter [Actinoalloteichus sp. GBA129-24]|uniref:Nramp family divalent metal transporter n=1 Tax=Actinoalloteichus sp. GBA129-24 TaxID=1612551 RepID=UPI0009505940|nr:Nramp family divalent metal transporter [Actinoalloteichus sp. GBA129-24]APU22905.1 Mn2+/Fe2+ transporter, NRAMP family [Actinoalloteichus sp. GBA129-24]